MLSIDGIQLPSRTDVLDALQSRKPDVTLLRLFIDRRGRALTFEIDTRGPGALIAEEDGSK